MLRAVANIMLGARRRGAEGSRQPGRRQPERRAAVARARASAAGQMGRGARGLPGGGGRDRHAAARAAAHALQEALRAAIEVRDFGDAANRLHEFETLGVPRELAPELDRAVRAASWRGSGASAGGAQLLSRRRRVDRTPGRRAGAAARAFAAPCDRRGEARGRGHEPRGAHRRMARRRHRGRGAGAAGAALCRGGPLPRRLPGHAHRARRRIRTRR